MKRIFNAIALGVIGGFFIGLDGAGVHIQAHRYLHYKLYRLAALELRSYLNRWVLLSAGAVVAAYVVWIVGSRCAGWVWRRFLSRYIELRIREGEIVSRRLFALGVATAFFLLAGFLFNYLYTGYRYSFASFAGDLLILLAAVLIGLRLGGRGGARRSAKLRSPAWGKGVRLTGAILVLCVVILNCALYIDRALFPPEGPNVILLCIDALRADHLGCYGYGRETSPNIDRFSEDALIFEDTFSQSSWTNPSIASLFTSQYPSAHGVTAFWGGRANTLRKKLVLLAEVLKDGGYATGAVVANHLVQERLNFDQGFDTFDPVNAEYKPRAEDVNAVALEWLSEHGDGPFFLYLHYVDVHGPYRPPAPYDSIFESDEVREMNESEYIKMSQYLLEDDIRDLNHYVDQYDGEIRYIDHYIGELLGALGERGLLDNSIVIITADHGEEFFDHGWCGHGLTLYNELIRVPLIVRLPGAAGGGEMKKVRSQLIDIGPTVLDLLGLRFPYRVAGRSLLSPMETGDSPPEGRTVFSEEHEWQTRWDSPPKVAMIEGDYKYIYHTREGKVLELYDIREDPGERENLAHARGAKVAQATAKIAAWLEEKRGEAAEMQLSREAPRLKKDDAVALRALGYL